MKKLYIEDYVKRISKQDLTDAYQENSEVQCARSFHVSVDIIKKLLSYYNIDCIPYKQRCMNQSSYKDFYKNILEKYSRDYIEATYLEHGINRGAKALEMCPQTFKKLLSILNIEEKSSTEYYAQRSLKISNDSFESVKSRINKEELENIYLNNNIHDTCNYFKTAEKTIYKLLELYDIQKRKTFNKITDIQLDNINQFIDIDKFKEIYYNEKSIEALMQQFQLSRDKIKRCIELLQLQQFSDQEIRSAAIQRRSKNVWDKLPRDLIQHLYENKKLSKSAICKELHISPKYLNLAIEDMHLIRPSSLFPNNSNSVPNLYFEQLLKDNNLTYQKEFIINICGKQNYRYDFKVDDVLIEINPSVTHNCTVGIRGGQAPIKSIDYHRKKSEIAQKNGYTCIHVWDWSDKELLIKKLLNKAIQKNVVFTAPRRYVYNLKLKQLVCSFEEDCVEIYDDGGQI